MMSNIKVVEGDITGCYDPYLSLQVISEYLHTRSARHVFSVYVSKSVKYNLQLL